MVLDNDDSDKTCAGDEAKGAIGDVNTGRVKRDTSLHNSLITSELALGSVKSIDALGLCYNVEDSLYINEPALRLGSCEQ